MSDDGFKLNLKIILGVAVTAWAIEEFGEKKISFEAIGRLSTLISKTVDEVTPTNAEQGE